VLVPAYVIELEVFGVALPLTVAMNEGAFTVASLVSNARANIDCRQIHKVWRKDMRLSGDSAHVPEGSQCPGCSGIALYRSYLLLLPARSLRITLPGSLCRRADWRKHPCLPRRFPRDRRSLFGWDYVNHKDRLQTPLIREGRGFREAS
jgi:hypothetical protein